MGNALLLSPAYGWFIGLLVVMIVVTALFALILFIALRPVKKDGYGGDASYAKALLGRREAELTAQLLKNQNNVVAMEHLMAKLRDVVAAEKLISELVEEDGGTQEPEPVKEPKVKKQPPQKPAQPAQAPAQAKPAAQPAKPAQAPAQAKPAQPAKPAQAKPAAQPAKPAEAKPEAPASGENKE